jgi:hypothetical protein
MSSNRVRLCILAHALRHSASKATIGVDLDRCQLGTTSFSRYQHESHTFIATFTLVTLSGPQTALIVHSPNQRLDIAHEEAYVPLLLTITPFIQLNLQARRLKRKPYKRRRVRATFFPKWLLVLGRREKHQMTQFLLPAIGNK